MRSEEEIRELPILRPYITTKSEEMLSPYVLTYWDNEKKDRLYENWRTIDEAQARFYAILMSGNTNVCILQRIQSIQYLEDFYNEGDWFQ